MVTGKRAVRIAELAFANKINNYHICLIKENETDVMYVFVDNLPIPDTDKNIFSLKTLKQMYDYIEIDSAFNVMIKDNFMCNMVLIYKLLFSWGVDMDYDLTGLFPQSRYKPQSLLELEDRLSEDYIPKTEKY